LYQKTLCTLPSCFAAMFWIFAGFWKIRISIFQHGILVSVSQLFLHADVPGCLMILSFHGTLCRILIKIALCHNSLSYEVGDL
jgi:hypothetical protein